jgi:hypothetical protein
MSWRTWFPRTLLPLLALASCVGAAHTPARADDGPAQPPPQQVGGYGPAEELEDLAAFESVPAGEPAGEPVAPAVRTLPQEPADEAETTEADEPAPARDPRLDDPRLEGMFVFERGPGLMPVLVARDEELTMSVRVKLGIAGSPRLGTVVLHSRVVPNRGSVLVRDAAPEAAGERAELIAEAKGGNSLYHLHEVRKSLLLPQDYPRIKHSSVQTGSENRKREQEIGLRDGEWLTRFRGDHHCGGCELQQHFVEPTWAWQDPRHCKKCKRAEHRVWREWQQRPLPVGAVDMVTAVTLGRTLLLLGESEMTFPLIDEEELWELTIRTGRVERISVDAGQFDATEILLQTRPAPGEDADPEDFKGLFGIHGTVSIWFDTKTGVPVQISGTVPLGPFTLDARVELESYRGTPAGFAPVS